jgi:hypothetical protein
MNVILDARIPIFKTVYFYTTHQVDVNLHPHNLIHESVLNYAIHEYTNKHPVMMENNFWHIL